MNKIIKLAKALSTLGLLSDSKSIIKLAGDAEVKYLEDLNFKSWIKGRDTNPTGDKREFWSNLQREFQNREGGGPIFGADVLSQVKEFDSNRLPKKGGKHFVKWLGRWAREWGVMPVADQNMILDWWSATGGVEEGASFDEKMIELLTPTYSLQRATEYHNDEGFYFDPTGDYKSSPRDNLIYDFGDGYKIVYVPAFGEMEPYPLTEAELEGEKNRTSYDRIMEGNKMGICLGKKMKLYQNNSGGKIYSLRNSSNEPCVTIRGEIDWVEERDDGVDPDDEDYEPMDHSKEVLKVYEFFGQGNSIPSKKYSDYILRFFRSSRASGGDWDEVDVEDQATLNLTKMNSSSREERRVGLEYMARNPSGASPIFSIDWKLVKEEFPEKFNLMILGNIFSSIGEDKLNPEKMGGDSEKIKLIKESYGGWINSKSFAFTKKIWLTEGSRWLLEIIPEALEKISLSDLLFPANTYTFLQTLDKNPDLRKIIWDGRISKLKESDIPIIAYVERIFQIFLNEIREVAASSPVVKILIKKALCSYPKPELIKALQALSNSIPAHVAGEDLGGLNFEWRAHLDDKIFDQITGNIVAGWKGISPFLIPGKVLSSGLTLSKEAILNILKESDSGRSGSPQEIYILIQFLKSKMVGEDPLSIFGRDFWKRVLLESLVGVNPKSPESVTYWIFSALIVPSEVKEALKDRLNKDLDFLKAAWDTYTLGGFFSREELDEILEHHSLINNLESQF